MYIIIDYSLIYNISGMITSLFNTYVQAPLFSYIAKQCKNDREMVTLLKKYKYLYSSKYIANIEYIYVINHCLQNNYYNSINIILYHTCPFMLFTVFNDVIDYLIGVITSRMSEKTLMKLYEKNEGHGFFTTNYDWLRNAVKYHKNITYIKFLFTKGHYRIHGEYTFKRPVDLYHYLINNDTYYGSSYYTNIYSVFIEHMKIILFGDSLRFAFITACLL